MLFPPGPAQPNAPNAGILRAGGYRLCNMYLR